jgi:hypothetical protein
VEQHHRFRKAVSFATLAGLKDLNARCPKNPDRVHDPGVDRHMWTEGYGELSIRHIAERE